MSLLICWLFVFPLFTKELQIDNFWTILCLTCPLLRFWLKGCAQPLVVDAKNLQQNLNRLKTVTYIRSKNDQFKAGPLPMAIAGRFEVVVNRVIHR